MSEITPSLKYLIELFDEYESGHYLYRGGVEDQPAKYFEAMKFIRQQSRRIMAELKR